MPRIVDAFLVKHRQDVARPRGVTAAQPQAFRAAGFPTLLEIHPVCHIRANRNDFGRIHPLTLDVTDADGFPVQPQVRTGVRLDEAKRTSLEATASEIIPCPTQRLILHEAGVYRLVLHLEGAPSFVTPFEVLGSDAKSANEPVHAARPVAGRV